MAGGNGGRLGEPQQHRQPLVQPPTPDSTDLKTSLNKTRRDIHLVEIKVLWGHQTSKPAECRIGTAQRPLQHSPRSLRYSPHHPFWVWAALSTTLTLWCLSRNWVWILKELRSLPPSSMCTLWTLLLNLSIPDVPFPVLLSTLKEPVAGQACNPLNPHWYFLSFSRWRSFTVLGT